jgi:hypothetical protein
VSADRPPLDAAAILRRIIERKVDFVVIGGIAAVLQGASRATFDLDICFATDADNLEALGDALLELGARLKGIAEDVPFVPDAATLRRVQVLTLETDSGELDVLASPAGAPPYAQLAAGADRYDLGGFSVLVASVDDLIAMKQAAGRIKDLADVEALEAIRRLRESGAAG